MATTVKTTTTAPAEMAPISLLPTYLMLVAVLKLKCKNVTDSDDADVYAACNALRLSVKKYRSFLAPLGKILPAASDLRAGLQGIEWEDHGGPIIHPAAFGKILKVFNRVERLYPSKLPGDEIHNSFFNVEKQASRRKRLEEGNVDLSEAEFVEEQYATLTQIRLSRQESKHSFNQLYKLLIASLVPQILILALVVAQWLLLKRRARAARKRNEKLAREQQLLGRLMEMRVETRQLE